MAASPSTGKLYTGKRVIMDFGHGGLVITLNSASDSDALELAVHRTIKRTIHAHRKKKYIK